MKVLAVPEVIEYLNNLVDILFEKYGKDMQYAVFKKNKHTSWYIFFTVYIENGEEKYLIRYIANNYYK